MTEHRLFVHFIIIDLEVSITVFANWLYRTHHINVLLCYRSLNGLVKLFSVTKKIKSFQRISPWPGPQLSDCWAECTLPARTGLRWGPFPTDIWMCSLWLGWQDHLAPEWKDEGGLNSVEEMHLKNPGSGQERSAQRRGGQMQICPTNLIGAVGAAEVLAGIVADNKHHQTYSWSSKWVFLEGADEQHNTSSLLPNTAQQGHLKQCKCG